MIKDIKEAQNRLKELKKELESFDDINIKSFDESTKDLTKLNTHIKAARALLQDLKPDLDYISSSFNESINSLQKTNYFIELQKKGLKGIVSQADMITSIKQGELDTDAKSIKKQQEKYKINLKNLKTARDSGEVSGDELKKLNKQIKEAELVEKGFKDVLKIHKEINKKLGLAPQLASGLDKALQKIGLPSLGIDDALKETQALGQAAKDAGESGFKPMSVFLGKIGSNLKDSFSKANLLQAAIVGLVKAFGESQKGIGDLAKGLGMSASRATVMRQEFADIANSSKNANLSVKDIQDTQLAVGQALGTNAMLNKEDLETMTDIVKKTGLQHSELIGIEKLSLATGKSLDDNVKSALGGATAFASQNKLAVDNNRVLREVNKASSSLKLSLGGSVEALGEAVMQAQKFGINLEQAESMASKLLDFESSIEAELSAELLTGKNLNLEKARGLALEGKSVEAAAEMLKQVGGTAEFSKMNVLQQEALADAVGMTRQGLADSLIEREALAAMGGKEQETALERYNQLVKEGKTREQIIDMAGEDAVQQLEQQSAQEKFNNSIIKLKEIFVQVMDALTPIFDTLANIATVVMPAINFVLQPIIEAFKTVGTTVAELFTWLSESKGVLITLGSLATGLYVTMNGAAIVAGVISTKKKLSLMWDERSLIIEKGKSVIDAVRLGYQTAMGSLAAREALMEKKGLALSIGKAVMKVIASLSSIPIIGYALGLAAAGTVAALGYSYMKDGMIGPGGEMVVSGPKGSIQLDKDDSIIAGTNLFDKNKSKSSPTSQSPNDGSSNVKIDMTQTNALLQRIIETNIQLINVIQTGGNVMLDGQKVGTALKLGSFKTQ
jgi:hypothetical protein